MRALNPDQLRTFIEVVQLGSFTAAARRLSLSQPAVSLQVQELEARCGVSLLDRQGKRPFPTEAGRQLVQHANRILKEQDEALAAMRRIKNSTGQHVRVGMTMTTLSYLARDVVRRLKLEHPEIQMSVVLSSSPALADDVRNRNLDLAIVTLPLELTQLRAQVFLEDAVMAIVPEDYFEPTPLVATPELMATAPFVTQNVGDVQTTLAETWFRSHQQAPHSYVEVRNLEACRAAVGAGLGVSIVPGITASQPVPGVVLLPLDPPVSRQIAIIEHESRPASPVVEKVRAALLTCGAPLATPRPRYRKASATRGATAGDVTTGA